MKKFFLKVLPTSITMAIIWILVACTIVLAATVLVLVNWDMNIVPGETTAQVFIDPAATIPAPAIHWGDIGRGSHQQFIFYVKNTGVEPINASMTIPENVSAYMTYSFTPASRPLSAGQIGQFTLNIDILPAAPLGPINGNYKVDTP